MFRIAWRLTSIAAPMTWSTALGSGLASVSRKFARTRFPKEVRRRNERRTNIFSGLGKVRADSWIVPSGNIRRGPAIPTRGLAAMYASSTAMLPGGATRSGLRMITSSFGTARQPSLTATA